MRVFRHVNEIFESNTYILLRDDYAGVYVVDPGDSFQIINWLKLHNKTISGVLLTHAHFDHMYGLNEILNCYPATNLYVSSLMIDGLYSEKLNTSLYHQKPYVLNKEYDRNINIIEESNELIFWNENRVSVLNTPGHTEDSVSLYIERFLFTGDALIPGINVFYRKKTSSHDSIAASLNRIYNTFPHDAILLPGHGKEYLLDESLNIKYFSKLVYNNDFIEIQK